MKAYMAWEVQSFPSFMSPWLHEFATRENSTRPRSPGAWSRRWPLTFHARQARLGRPRASKRPPPLEPLAPRTGAAGALGPASPPPRRPARGPAVREGVTVPPGLAAPAPRPPPPTFCPLPAYVTSWGPAAAPWRPGAEEGTWWAARAGGRKEAGHRPAEPGNHRGNSRNSEQLSRNSAADLPPAPECDSSRPAPPLGRRPLSWEGGRSQAPRRVGGARGPRRVGGVGGGGRGRP